jgi:hypothetical protein
LQAHSPELLPEATAPNAYFRAPTVGIGDLAMDGDWLQIEANFVRLGALDLQPGTVVHIDPLVNLPFFAEPVDIESAGLGAVSGLIAASAGRVTPNLGSFTDDVGSRPVVDASLHVSVPVTLDTEAPPADFNLSDFIVDSGLGESTLVIGASDYQASIQVSDQQAIDVRPHATNFVFLTAAGVLVTTPIQTGGQVLILGRLFTERGAFYQLVVQEIQSYYAQLASAGEPQDDEEQEEREGSDNLRCE